MKCKSVPHEPYGAKRHGFPARVFALGAWLAIGAANADEISGEDTFICTAWHAITCTTEATCNQTEAWRLDMPDFIKVDLDEKVLVTPERSDQPRFAMIGNVERNQGMLFLTGSQDARGYTWVINEATGEGTLAIVTDTTVVTLFTACAATSVLR